MLGSLCQASFKTVNRTAFVSRWGSTLRVLLLKNLENYGTAGEVVDVKRGYARNFLIPRKIAGK